MNESPAKGLSSFESHSPVQIRVLIVDDHAVVRRGLRDFIELQADMTVVGEGTDGIEAVALAERLRPDVVLLDLVMPRMDGVEATRRILAIDPACRVLILTSFGEDDKVFPAIRAGALGYLLKDIHPNELIEAIREVQQGNARVHPNIVGRLMAAVAAGQPGPDRLTSSRDASHPEQVANDLTERELETLRWIARGRSNREIAEAMVVSEKTVKTHVSNLLSKLGVEDRTQAAIWALKHGLGSEESE